jgi:hypothetical protein
VRGDAPPPAGGQQPGSAAVRRPTADTRSRWGRWPARSRWGPRRAQLRDRRSKLVCWGATPSVARQRNRGPTPVTAPGLVSISNPERSRSARSTRGAGRRHHVLLGAERQRADRPGGDRQPRHRSTCPTWSSAPRSRPAPRSPAVSAAARCSAGATTATVSSASGAAVPLAHRGARVGGAIRSPPATGTPALQLREWSETCSTTPWLGRRSGGNSATVTTDRAPGPLTVGIRPWPSPLATPTPAPSRQARLWCGPRNAGGLGPTRLIDVHTPIEIESTDGPPAVAGAALPAQS